MRVGKVPFITFVSLNVRVLQGLATSTVIKHAQFPFELGVLENVYSVFGRNVFLWLLPMGARGDGLSFSIRLDLQGVSFLT